MPDSPSSSPSQSVSAPTHTAPAVRRRLLVLGGAGVVLAVAIGLATAFVPGVAAFDRQWSQWSGVWRADDRWFSSVAYALNWLGGSWRAFVVGAVVAALVWWRRGGREALVVAVAALAGAAVVQVLKWAFDRDRPTDMLVTSDAGSYPSGHVANAAVTTVVVALLVRRVWLWVVATIVTLAMLLSRTYLSVHWLSDTIGGAVLGAGVACLVVALMFGFVRRT